MEGDIFLPLARRMWNTKLIKRQSGCLDGGGKRPAREKRAEHSKLRKMSWGWGEAGGPASRGWRSRMSGRLGRREFGSGCFFCGSSEGLSSLGRTVWYLLILRPWGSAWGNQPSAWASWPQAVRHQQAEFFPAPDLWARAAIALLLTYWSCPAIKKISHGRWNGCYRAWAPGELRLPLPCATGHR